MATPGKAQATSSDQEQAEIRALACCLAYAFGRSASTEAVLALAPIGFFTNRFWEAYAQELYDVGVRPPAGKEAVSEADHGGA